MPTYDEHGYSEEFYKDREAGTLGGAPPPETGPLARALGYIGASPFEALSGVGKSVSNVFGTPSHESDPSLSMAPAQTGLGKVIDVAGHLLPVAETIAATGPLAAGILGPARAAAHPLVLRALQEAMGFGVVGAEESRVTGVEQAGEGLAYGAISGIKSRLARLPLAAAAALASKAFFDRNGAQPVVAGLSAGDISLMAGLGASLLPGAPKHMPLTDHFADIPGGIPKPTGISPEAMMQGPESIQASRDVAQAHFFPPALPGTLQKSTPSTIYAKELSDTLQRALEAHAVRPEQEATVARFLGSQNAEADINAVKSKVASAPEYQRSEGGFFTQEAAMQLAAAGGRGLLGATFGGAAAHFDPNDTIDPKNAAMTGFILGALGPEVGRQFLQRLQSAKAMAKTTPLNHEAGSILSSAGTKREILGPALRNADNETYKGTISNRDTHAKLKLKAAQEGLDFTEAEHVFHDNEGNTLTRPDAEIVAREAGQVPQDFKAGPKGIQSEDLISHQKKIPDNSIKQTETPEFKKWFEGSQTADEAGKPKVFYHGTQTKNDFNEFNPEANQLGFVSVTESPKFASGWVGVGEHVKHDKFILHSNDTSPRIYPVFVRAKKIWDYTNPEHRDLLLNEINKNPASNLRGPTYYENRIKEGKWTVIEEQKDFLKKEGFDGFYTSEGDVGGNPSRNLHVFDPENIKSATGNSGEFSLKNKDIRGSVLPEVNQALARATIGGLVGSFAGGITDDPDQRTGMVVGGMVGAGAAMFGPTMARTLVRAMAKTATAIPAAGKPSIMKDFAHMITNLGQTIEEHAGATITRGSSKVGDRFARSLQQMLEINLPEAVKAKLLEAKGLASMFLDQIDSSLLKVSLRYTPDDIVKGITNTFLDGKIDAAGFLQQLQPHVAASPQLAHYAQFVLAGRAGVDGLQHMLLSGIGDPKLHGIIKDSIGKYLTRSYKLFTNPNWQPDESTISKLIDYIHKGNYFGVGATMPDIENHLRQYIREIKLNKGAYKISGFAEGTKINQALLKERVTMEQEWKNFFGEITDPTERIYQTIFRLRPMAEASKYFEGLVGLEADGMPQVFRNYAEKDVYKTKLLQSLQNATPAEKLLIDRKLNRLGAYQNVENNVKFGALQGHIVSLPVWDTLATFDNASSTFGHPLMQSFVNIHTAIKLGRTALNPLTVIRNMVTTPAFMLIGRAGMKDMAESWDVLRNSNHPLRAELLRQGIMNVDQVKTEFFKEFENITGHKYNFGNVDLGILGLGKLDLDLAERVSRRGFRGVLDFYRLPDNIVRMGSYLSAKRRIAEQLGVAMDHPDVISKATEFTNRYTMNYDAVSPLIKTFRQLPFSNLFISYTAEMMRIVKNLGEDVLLGSQNNLAHHERLHAIIPLASLAVLPELLQTSAENALSPKDKIDWEKAKKLMPDYARTRYRVGINRDPKTGTFHYIDFTPLIASDNLNQMVKAIVTGDGAAAAKVNPFANFDNTPALNIIAEQIAGKDLRTHREFRGGADRVAAVAKEMLPPWMPGGFEYDRFRQAHATTNTGEQGLTNLKTGIRITPSDFWSTYFGPIAGQMIPPGTKTGSVSLALLEKKATQEAKHSVANETSYLNDVLNSNVEDSKKAQAVERFNKTMSNLVENYRAKMGVDAQ